MGLDMYLYRSNPDKPINLDEDLYSKARDEFGDIDSSAEDAAENSYSSWRKFYEEISNLEEVAYWRKSNQIHNWFVEHVAGGVDDCQMIPVSLEQLAGLLSLCNRLLRGRSADDARIYLPTREGFFFGSTEYDNDYWSALEETAKILERILEFEMKRYARKLKPCVYTYQSSW